MFNLAIHSWWLPDVILRILDILSILIFFGTEAIPSSLAPWLPQYHRGFSKDPYFSAYEIIHKFSWEVVHPLYTAINQGFHHCSLWVKLVMKDAFF